MTHPFQALTQAFENEHWLDEANCSALTAELFWVDKGGSVAPAKAICRDCPVKRECLEWALTHNEREGVWGGLAPSERRGLHAGRPIPAPTLCINGHDINRVGTRGSDGYCKQCDRERWQRYKNRQKMGLVPQDAPKARTGRHHRPGRPRAPQTQPGLPMLDLLRRERGEATQDPRQET